LTVNGGASFDATSAYNTVINQAGATAGTDYSQLSASGTVTIAGSLSVQGGDPSTGNCPVLNVGDVLTLIKTSGALSGTFSNASDGSTMQLSCSGGIAPTFRINYLAKSVTATVISGSTTSLSASPTGPVTNQSTTLTATVAPAYGSGAASGAVEFDNNGTAISGCSSVPVSSGTAACQTSFTASTSPESLTAKYMPAAGSGYSGSSSSPLAMTVGKDSTSTTVSASTTSPGIGQSVTYTATVTPGHSGSTMPSGTASFSDNGSPISGCSAQPLTKGASSSTATCTTSYSSAGSHAITASYGGDGNFTGSNSTAQTVTVAQPGPPAPTTGSTVFGTAVVSGTSVAVMITCNGPANATCNDVVQLSIVETLKGGKLVAISPHVKTKKKVVVLGSVSVTLTGGQTKTVTISLNGAGKSLLAKRHTLKVTLTIKQSGKTVTTKTVTFKSKKKKH
jgi:hypothetical protein